MQGKCSHPSLWAWLLLQVHHACRRPPIPEAHAHPPPSHTGAGRLKKPSCCQCPRARLNVAAATPCPLAGFLGPDCVPRPPWAYNRLGPTCLPAHPDQARPCGCAHLAARHSAARCAQRSRHSTGERARNTRGWGCARGCWSWSTRVCCVYSA